MIDYKIKFSYTFIRDYDNCPEQARSVHVLKAFKKSFTAERAGGIDTHLALDKRLKAKTPLPPEMGQAEIFVQTFERYGAPESEVMLGVDHMWRPVGFWDGWLRGKFDVVVRDRATRRAVIGDWKDGKVRESDAQLEIGAHLLMQTDPTIDEVLGFNIWLQTNKIGTPYRFHRGDGTTARLTKKLRDIEAMSASGPWEQRQGPLCRWCPVQTCPNYSGG